MGNLSTPKSVQKLQTALHAKAKAEAGYRYYAAIGPSSPVDRGYDDWCSRLRDIRVHKMRRYAPLSTSCPVVTVRGGTLPHSKIVT